MAKHENLPFPIGTTYFDGQTADTTTNTAINLEGKEFEIEDLNYTSSTYSSTKTLRTAYLKRVRILRNASGVAVLPGYLVEPSAGGSDGKFYIGRTDGYSNVGGQAPKGTVPAYGIDEFLPSAGVPSNDLFYATVEGPFLGVSSSTAADLLGLSNDAGTARPIGVGDVLVAATAAASTNTTNMSTATCGRIASLTGHTSAITMTFAILNRIGRALSAITTTQTNTSLLMYFTKF